MAVARDIAAGITKLPSEYQDFSAKICTRMRRFSSGQGGSHLDSKRSARGLNPIHLKPLVQIRKDLQKLRFATVATDFHESERA